MSLHTGKTMVLVAGKAQLPLNTFLLLNEIQPENEKAIVNELITKGEYLFDKNTPHEILVQVMSK